MKICLINNLYKPYARGGAETVVGLITDGLKKDGHEVFIITTKPVFANVKSPAYAKASAGKQKSKVYYINGLYFNLGKIPKFLRLFWHIIDMFDVGSYWRVKSILKKEKPDVVMTHNLKGIGYLIPRAIRNLKIKHVHTLHDIQLLHPSGLMFYGKEKMVNSFFSKIYQGLCRNLFGSPDIIISPSKWLMSEHVNRGFFGGSNKVVIANPIANMEHETQNIEHEKKNFRFLYVGLIEEHKGVLFMIKAFKKFSGHKLLIVGNGSQFKKAQELIGQNENIKLLGRINNDEAKKLMSESDALIMPSTCYENSPAVIYEAMSAGLPVIASRIGGVPEIVPDENLLFEPENEKDLISKMKRIVEHESELREAERIKDFKVENYIKKIINLL